jgi:hypothetical protein
MTGHNRVREDLIPAFMLTINAGRQVVEHLAQLLGGRNIGTGDHAAEGHQGGMPARGIVYHIPWRRHASLNQQPRSRCHGLWRCHPYPTRQATSIARR